MMWLLYAMTFLALCFGLSALNIRRGASSSRFKFGDPGIGQRDDYDADIRSSEITAMRNAQRVYDLDKALDSFTSGE
jgi:hypothetical protein